MGTFYLDVETTGLDPAKDRIITIQFQELDRYTGEAVGELVILKEWESSEKEILKEFIEKSGILDSYDFSFVPIGYNLGFEHNFLKIRSELNGLPSLDILNFPFIDLRAVGILMNRGQFKGSGLSDLTGKKGIGSHVPVWYENKEYDKITGYVKNETEEFIKFNKWLYKKMPDLFREFSKDAGLS
ncbi:MAG TPA: ribonuclease H-like domain-containing protein [Candidatus Nanoarchaeia archaeon]|nr:ribonuclease H-like domain-containing protein [Candidatus Nanoarchaeia archaeon]